MSGRDVGPCGGPHGISARALVREVGEAIRITREPFSWPTTIAWSFLSLHVTSVLWLKLWGQFAFLDIFARSHSTRHRMNTVSQVSPRSSWKTRSHETHLPYDSSFLVPIILNQKCCADSRWTRSNSATSKLARGQAIADVWPVLAGGRSSLNSRRRFRR